jgi:predicted CopG family antitoxin
MRTITIEVNDNAAERFFKMSNKEKKNVANIVIELIKDTRSLDQVMDDMAIYAKEHGLTPEKLDEILNED